MRRNAIGPIPKKPYVRINVPSPMERFQRWWTPEPFSGCWLWIGNFQNQGYGWFSINGKGTLAHRAAWMLYKGPIPDGLGVLHKCDVRACVNPDHLFLGDQFVNMQDAVTKRRPRGAGERHGFAKLTEAAVRVIRGTNERTCVLVKRFGVSRNAIDQVRSWKTWREVV